MSLTSALTAHASDEPHLTAGVAAGTQAPSLSTWCKTAVNLLPVEPTLDHDGQDAKPYSSLGATPLGLLEHPRYEIVRLIGKGGG
jgi:hypothetical protein